jgi:polyketide cyclase/dehydrase/lipid transport protein
VWKSEFSAETAASSDAVWAVLADVSAWPSWNPGYSAASLDGPLVPGAAGSVTLPNGWKRPFSVLEVVHGEFFAYGGAIPGARQRFVQKVEHLDIGRTRVTLGHTIEGPTSFIFGLLFGRTIRGYLPTGLARLTAKAEGR